MYLKYILQLPFHQLYSFGAASTHTHIIRFTHLSKNSQQHRQFKEKLELVLTIKSHLLVNMLQVRQIKDKGFVIDYEYVHDSIRNSTRINQAAFVEQLKCKMHQLFQQLSMAKVCFFPTLDNIGIDQQGKPKVYIQLPLIYAEEGQQNLWRKYQEWNQKLFSSIKSLKESSHQVSQQTMMSQYSQKFIKKIKEIEGRINQIKGRKMSQHIYRSNNTIKLKKQSNMVLQYINHKKIRNNSFAEGAVYHQQSEKGRKLKNKLSVGDDSLTTSKISKHSSSREESLRQRLAQAMQKTQQALLFYDRLKRR